MMASFGSIIGQLDFSKLDMPKLMAGMYNRTSGIKSSSTNGD